MRLFHSAHATGPQGLKSRYKLLLNKINETQATFCTPLWALREHSLHLQSVPFQSVFSKIPSKVSCFDMCTLYRHPPPSSGALSPLPRVADSARAACPPTTQPSQRIYRQARRPEGGPGDLSRQAKRCTSGSRPCMYLMDDPGGPKAGQVIWIMSPSDH